MSLEHERALLEAILCNQDTIDNEAIDESLFSDLHYSAIFRSIDSVRKKKIAVDRISVSDSLREQGYGESIPVFASLTPFTAANAHYYAENLKDTSKRRKLLLTTNDLARSLNDPSIPVEQSISEAEIAFITAVAANPTAKTKSIASVLKSTITEINSEMQDRASGKYKGIETGLSAMTAQIGTFRPGELIVVGARPGSGKTVFSLGVAVHASLHAAIPAVFLNIEMREEDLGRRILSSISGIHHTKLREVYLKESDIPALIDASAKLHSAPLYVYTGPLTMPTIRSVLRRESSVSGVKIAIIDYFGLITFPDDKRERWERFSDASKALKNLALELNMVIILNVQLNRDAAGREPLLSDIRDTGSIEQDADMVIFLHPLDKVPEADKQGLRKFLAIVAKNRRGPAARIELVLDGPHCKFLGGED